MNADLAVDTTFVHTLIGGTRHGQAVEHVRRGASEWTFVDPDERYLRRTFVESSKQVVAYVHDEMSDSEAEVAVAGFTQPTAAPNVQDMKRLIKTAQDACAELERFAARWAAYVEKQAPAVEFVKTNRPGPRQPPLSERTPSTPEPSA
jgi:hypothetical protein